MNQIHPSVDGFVAMKQDLAKMERSQNEFVELKRQHTMSFAPIFHSNSNQIDKSSNNAKNIT
jgi:hypothetical protein